MRVKETKTNLRTLKQFHKRFANGEQYLYISLATGEIDDLDNWN